MADTVPSPSEEELQALRQDAQQNVAGAHDALHGDEEALRNWRALREASSAK